jgi:hypothetical protein
MANRSGYEDVDILRDADGIIAIISRRISTGSYSVALMKEFERDDRTERTSFVPRKGIDAGKRILDRAADRIDELMSLDSQRAARTV